MAFSFATKTRGSHTLAAGSNQTLGTLSLATTNKLSSAQLSKSAKLLYPAWLKDNASCLKQLPGLYHGVLGQVQLQPRLQLAMGQDQSSSKFSTGLEKLVREHQKTDYLNRLTDTERVRQLLSTSRLSDEHLATIWAHVNKTFPGQLTNREVCLALALIAIFQRLQKEAKLEDEIRPNSKNDPFVLVKLEKKPPVPNLYPGEVGHKSSSARLAGSNSVPNDLGALLIDIDEDSPQVATRLTTSNSNNNNIDMVSLLDDGGDAYLAKLKNVWMRFMSALKAVFKRSFDILQVENSRSSALEALRSDKGRAFCKNLCLCYPLAHNVASKIDEIASLEGGQGTRLLGANYVAQITDLMVSINEYWAVLINLFHESGHTDFIELIMDGLNRDNATLISTGASTLEELRCELDTANKRDLCSLCHTKFYLVNIGDLLERRNSSKLPELELKLVLSNELLCEQSPLEQEDEAEVYFYHAKCANFWLNHVPGAELPFRRDSTILKPTI